METQKLKIAIFSRNKHTYISTHQSTEAKDEITESFILSNCTAIIKQKDTNDIIKTCFINVQIKAKLIK